VVRVPVPAVAAVLLGFGVAVFGHTIDLGIADRAFDASSATWLVDHRPGGWRFAFYDGPKYALVLFGMALLAGLFCHRRLDGDRQQRQAVLFLFLCLAIVPSVTGAVKSASGISCPYATERYGGHMPDANGRFSLAGFTDPSRTDGCWPSGHVSGAFALLGILCLNVPKRRLLAAAATTAGVAMGGYQVLRGAHFASHIVVSFCIATIVVTVLQQLLLTRQADVRVRSPAVNKPRTRAVFAKSGR
ncbi:MAG: phosphatase PAP2 family protein, partial [Woeseia sp.]